MPLGAFRLGLLAWSQRGSITRFAVGIGVAVLLVPMLLGAMVSAAVANLPVPGGPGVKPMAGWQVSQPFGCTGFALEPPSGDCAHFHSGIDLVGPLGSAVYSVLPGLVEVRPPSGFGGGYGIHVLVHHDGATLTLYAHLLTATVITGQPVVAGALIGYEGSTGLSTGPHLHFEVRRAGVPVDPAKFFPAIFGANAPAANNPTGAAPLRPR